MPTRRVFLMNAALLACGAEPGLPVGVIAPYRWEDREIPVESGEAQIEAIDKSVTDAMRQHGIVGCGVCVVRDGAMVYARGYGYAELPGTPFLADTTSRCGSVAKPVTGLCALLLCDQGKLDLDDYVLPLLHRAGIDPKPVGAARPDERLGQIRVRHLMDHTSGFPRGATYTAWRADRNLAVVQKLNHVATAADVVSDALGNTRLDSDPGAQFQYANINFVMLARMIEVVSGQKFNDFLTRVATPRFGVGPEGIHVSANQTEPTSRGRGKQEAAYYQTNGERFVSFVPSEQERGQIYGEAYRGYATESSDGAGGIACSALGLGKILANLGSARPALAARSITELRTPPAHYATQANFDPAGGGFYSKGFNVRLIGGRAWLAHGGMTIHCGGAIGHNAGYQFAVVSNWNNAGQPFVDSILDRALAEAVGKLNR